MLPPVLLQFELGNPSNNITVGGYNPYGMSPDDERLKAYTPYSLHN